MEENVIQTEGGIMTNVDVSVKNVMQLSCHVMYYIWNSSACNCEKVKYLASIMDDSLITCDEVKVIRKRNTDYSSKL